MNQGNCQQMEQPTEAFKHLILPIIMVVMVIKIATWNLAWAQDDLIVQPARRNITLTGYTRSQTTVTLSSEVNGRILKVNYDDGQVIDKLPFLDIDPRFIDLRSVALNIPWIS